MQPLSYLKPPPNLVLAESQTPLIFKEIFIADTVQYLVINYISAIISKSVNAKSVLSDKQLVDTAEF
jgi:hypothetical protein